MKVKNLRRVFPTVGNLSHYTAKYNGKSIDIYFDSNTMETSVYHNGVKKFTGKWTSGMGFEEWLDEFIAANWVN